MTLIWTRILSPRSWRVFSSPKSNLWAHSPSSSRQPCCCQHPFLTKTVRPELYDFMLLSQSSFTVAGRRLEAPGSEREDFLSHGTTSSVSIGMLVSEGRTRHAWSRRMLRVSVLDCNGGTRAWRICCFYNKQSTSRLFVQGQRLPFLSSATAVLRKSPGNRLDGPLKSWHTQ